VFEAKEETQMANTEVLIVGAGPTGLAAACELTRWGVKVRIIDKNQGRSVNSKALGVHAGTLECLEESFGKEFSQRMVDAGFPVKGVHLSVYGTTNVHVDLSQIPSKYNFVLVLAQSETEKFLEEYLNKQVVAVERSNELIATKEENGKVVSLIRDPTGKELEVESDFVIGADGAHSVVRHSLGLAFEGSSYPQEFVLGDVEIEWDWPFGDLRGFMTKHGLLACFPMDPKGIYRLVFINPNKMASTDEVTLSDFISDVELICPGLMKIKKEIWLSRFRVHHRCVNHLQQGRIFIAGDAAHIHSPIGGQGMNTGIQDSISLSAKLALVLRKNAPLSLLENYEKERLPVAKNVLRITDLATRFGLSGGNILTRAVKTVALPLMNIEVLQKEVVREMSQVDVARADIEIRAVMTNHRSPCAAKS
jgi:2-polyprenyl-6-methoxyphenol hydroxylase-like FAD-dependent oxidoreductase